jgi:hypothetical protein
MELQLSKQHTGMMHFDFFSARYITFESLHKINICLFSGPDTDGVKMLIPSSDATAPPSPNPSEWTMRLFWSLNPLSSMPDVANLKLISQKTIRAIDFRNAADLQKVGDHR